MTHQPRDIDRTARPLDPAKFRDPDRTARARPGPAWRWALETLWINTGTLCNIACANCYIESSPGNDRLAYFELADALALYDEIADLGLGTAEIGFTGGEPFMNPELPAMLAAALERGFSVLVLTNAMRPMQRPRIMAELLALKERHGRPSAAGEPRPLRAGAARARARPRHLGAGGRRARLAGGQRIRDLGGRAHLLGRAHGRRRGRAMPRCSRPAAGRSMPPTRPPWCCSPRWTRGRRARDHHRLLGHPAQEARRHHVRHEPHGGEAQGRDPRR
jgi:hypothetical protein